jgi:transcriptional regulator with XRE-family HTH domain
MSQRSLSARTGRSPAYVSKLESGQLDPGLRGFAAVAVALNLSPLEVWVLLRLEAAADAVTVTPSEDDGRKNLRRVV